MRILFVVKSKTIETLGPQYLAAVVKKAGHECHIVDLPNAYGFALEWKPNLVGYSIMTGDQQKFIALNKQIKAEIHCASIFGGPHATFFPDDFPDDPVALGESEQDIADLLKSTAKYVDINSLPWPDRSDFPDRPIRDFLASRGCKFRCSYCYNDRWGGMIDNKKIRTRDPFDVAAEVHHVKPQFAYFQDSCFGLSLKWLNKFTQVYNRTLFHCHLHPNQIEEERIVLLHNAGCYSLRVALESAVPKQRKLLGRANYNNDDFIKGIHMISKWGIKPMIQNMIGLPTGIIEDDLTTLDLNIRCQPAYAWVSIYTPYPGTKLGDYCKEHGFYDGDYSDIADNFFDKTVLSFSEEYKEQIICLQRIFALCVEMQYLPNAKELAFENFPKLIHKIMRHMGDKRLYGGVV